MDERDAGRVARFVAEIDPGTVEEPFPRPFLAALRRLVPCDDVTFSELDRVQDLQIGPLAEPEYEGQEPPVSYWEIRHEHPTCRYHELTGDFRAYRVSDFVGRRELRASRLYNDWFRPQGIEHELSVGLDAPLWHTKVFLFARSDGRDFAERDRLVLDAVRPHLAGRYERWQTRRRLADVLRLAEVATARSCRSTARVTRRTPRVRPAFCSSDTSGARTERSPPRSPPGCECRRTSLSRSRRARGRWSSGRRARPCCSRSAPAASG